jgi:hypothetical protein
MATVDGPYLWMGRGLRSGWNAWLEYPAGATSHADLVEVADRLNRDFGAVVIERLPESPREEGKEYWRLRVGSDVLMLMRKPPGMPVGLCVESGNVELLVRIGREWGIERFVGWRWRLWRASRWLAGRRDD